MLKLGGIPPVGRNGHLESAVDLALAPVADTMIGDGPLSGDAEDVSSSLLSKLSCELNRRSIV